MDGFRVDFFRKADGTCPVEEFLDSLDVKMRAKVVMGLSLLRRNGPLLREPYSKSLGDGIFELRTQQANNITRVLYFFFDGRQIIMTNGFVKKTRRTPPGEIALAKRYRDEYYDKRGDQNG